jgi:hypothetical protein
MTELRNSISSLRDALSDLEGDLNDNDRSAADLEDLKAALDRARTTVLAVLAAAKPSDYPSFVRRFRLQRATQVCQTLVFSVMDGSTSRRTPGIERLRSTVDDVLQKLEAGGS